MNGNGDQWQAALAMLLLTVLIVSLTVGGEYVSLTAPISGGAWATVGDANPGAIGNQAVRSLTGPGTVESPYGGATVRYDRRGVPHITAENERALAFATGYVQARDRLFQMDLQRRLMAGNLSAAFGNRTLDSDRFHRQMGFRDAANASWAAIENTEAARGVEAYTAGVNHYIDTRPSPLEFRLNDYEPVRWTPEDTLLVGKLIAWQLSGDFADLRQQTIRDRLPTATALYPRQLDHEATIVDRSRRLRVTGQVPHAVESVHRTPDISDSLTRPVTDTYTGGDTPRGLRQKKRESGDRGFKAVYEAVRPHEPSGRLASNSWIVSGEHTASGEPLLANDPHLPLTVPPVWYGMHLQTGDLNVRGVALPGVPAVVIGQNDDVAWGFTNVGADQTDVYTYEWTDDETYQYRGEDRDIQTHTETIRVRDGENVQVTVRRTVHGPLIEREGTAVAVAWIGLTGTREAQGIYRLNRARDLDELRQALRVFDTPTQNIVASERGGGTLYRITGKYPVRRVDGEVVAGDRVFNGSAGHGEWRGFDPYGQTSWMGFVPFEDYPELRDSEYVGTANQRVMDEPGFYIATSTRYADPYRGARIYELLEHRIADEDPVTPEFFRDIQQDTHSGAAGQFVPQIINASERMNPETRAAATRLEHWDHEMQRDSRAALLFALWLERYRNATLGDEYRSAGLDGSYFPHYWTVGRLPPTSQWFDDVRTPERETRGDIIARTLRMAVQEANRKEYQVYGDYNRLSMEHQFPLAALDYPERPMNGSGFTLYNVRAARAPQAGSSWRFIATTRGQGSDVGPSMAVLPGGQSGNYFSPHYRDQLDGWATGDYYPLITPNEGRTIVVFEGGDE